MSVDVVGWTIAGFLLGVLSTLLAHATVYFARARKGRQLQLGDSKKVYPDPEKGEGATCPSEVKTAWQIAAPAAPVTPRHFCETLKQLLETELPKGLVASGLVEQLE